MRVWSSWQRMKTPNYNLQGRKDHQFVSVIVVGRNEEQHIATCLRSIANVRYPKDKFEILFVDDHSEDKTLELVNGLDVDQLKVLQLANDTHSLESKSFKKRAIRFALQHAQGELIACTDADCVVPTQWLSYIDYAMQQALVRMLVMPICFEEPESILGRFQSLDMMATMAFTGYGIKNGLFYSANGANLAFRKELYEAVDTREEFASGDDLFLVQAVGDLYPDGVKFLKSKQVIVQTNSEPSWALLRQQRKRWAAKSSGYASRGLYKLQIGIFLFNALIYAHLILGLTVNSLFLFIGLFQLFVKGIMDYLLLTNMADFFQQRKSLKWFLISFFLFAPYLFFMGFWAVVGGRVEWKGREVR